MAAGPAAGLVLIEALASSLVLQSYHLLPSARGDLLIKLGRLTEARAELERAAALARNARDRELLLRRAAECGVSNGPSALGVHVTKASAAASDVPNSCNKS